MKAPGRRWSLQTVGILAVLAGLKVTRNRTEGREFWWGPGKGMASNLMSWAGQGS